MSAKRSRSPLAASGDAVERAMVAHQRQVQKALAAWEPPGTLAKGRLFADVAGLRLPSELMTPTLWEPTRTKLLAASLAELPAMKRSILPTALGRPPASMPSDR
jgi:hypothetical protein